MYLSTYKYSKQVGRITTNFVQMKISPVLLENCFCTLLNHEGDE